MAFSKDFFRNLQNSMKFLNPILMTIILASVLSFVVNISLEGITPEDITPVPGPPNPGENPVEAIYAALINALIYVSIALFGGVFLVYLIRSGKVKIIELIFASMMGFSTFIFGLYVLPWIPYLIYISVKEIQDFEFWNFIINDFMVLISAGLGVLSFLVLGLQRFKSQKIHNFLMILFGALMGVVLGRHIPAYILLVILLALAIYDIYAVFWGPIKHMFESPSSGNNQNEYTKNTEEFSNKSIESETILNDSDLENTENKMNGENIETLGKDSKEPRYYEINENLPISLPVYYTPEISIGLGDFVFFSVLVGKSVFEGLISNNYWFFILPFIGIVIGSYITFRLLEKKEILPALPIPILIGTFGFILALFDTPIIFSIIGLLVLLLVLNTIRKIMQNTVLNLKNFIFFGYIINLLLFFTVIVIFYLNFPFEKTIIEILEQGVINAVTWPFSIPVFLLNGISDFLSPKNQIFESLAMIFLTMIGFISAKVFMQDNKQKLSN